MQKKKKDLSALPVLLSDLNSWQQGLNLQKLIEEKFKSYKDLSISLSDNANKIVVQNQNDLNIAETVVANIIENTKAIEEKKKFYKSDAWEYCKTIDKSVKEVIDVIDNAKFIINDKITKYKQLQRAVAEMQLKKAEKENLVPEI
jgi:hypothetical protein